MCILKYCLQIVDHIVLASMCYGKWRTGDEAQYYSTHSRYFYRDAAYYKDTNGIGTTDPSFQQIQ